MKIAIVAAAVVSLAAVSNGARAENGRNGAAVLGGVAGVAIGAAGATMLMNQNRAPRVSEPVEYVEEERPREPACAMRMIDLFDRDGNFVKKDRVRVCR